MSKLFEATEINGMQLANRFVRSATYEALAQEDGGCSPRLVAYMNQLAEGGVGLIITSHAYVRPDGQGGYRQIGIYKDDFIEGYREMTQEVHKRGARIAMQITHGGFFSNDTLTAQRSLAPSQVEGFGQSRSREMGVEEIQDLIEAYAQAARRAKEAQFDGVQIHAAHGYMMSQFLSPVFNQRTDAYGGPVENRARVLLEVLQKVRAEVGPGYPVLVKMNCRDFLPNGLELEDSIQVALELQEAGIDAIELSGGTIVSGELSHCREGITSEKKEAYFREESKVLKGRLLVPLILVGGIRSLQLADRLVNEGYADYISMSRPFIREPGLIKRWKSGDVQKATCISDNQCRGPVLAGEALHCVVEKKLKEGK
ncbi:MAG: NADH:flavin oxidoreductase [Desulfobacteraceae bacterium]|jgi:2,4-dienoyl-CoA reductase-like NADH-dependent reductase (Old Yellow Enzyme family)